MSKIVFVGRMGWLVANTKTKRKQLRKKTLKWPKSVKNENVEKRMKNIFPIDTDRHTYIHQSDYRGSGLIVIQTCRLLIEKKFLIYNGRI